MNPFQVVRDFEVAVGEYTGAPYVVAVNSCTAALRLALRWWHGEYCYGCGVVSVPKRTYPSVPMAAVWAGYEIVWTDEEWQGEYQLRPTNVWDSAKRFTGGMFRPGAFQCVSFHPQKSLALSTGGGAILHDSAAADSWFRRMRFDGREEGVPTRDDVYTVIGEHCYMFPSQAAEGLHRLSIYARQYHHDDQPSELDEYPDCSLFPIFQCR
jgi:dTDP-4-amino-4,6-dideoxygalactose transaminase